MKTTHPLSIISLIVICCTFQACGHPEQKFSISVKDDNGEPLKHVESKAWFKLPGEGDSIKDYAVTGKTDINGRVELAGNTIWAPTSVEARMEGYYLSMAGNHWAISKEGNRWEPWPVEVNLVMKKIVNPKPMYVAKFDGQKWLAFPDKQLEPFGFDLMAGDWVAPHGIGRVADFIIQAIRNDEDESTINPKGKIILTFSNPDDGILKMVDQGGSILIGPGTAPEEGYEGSWDFPNWQPHATEENLISQDFSDEVYVFRVRTKLDDEGNVINSHYGKIHGRIVGWLPQAVPSVIMTYYLNGSINNRGLEWDTKSNLIEDTSRMSIPERP